jgi:outer membrane protein TolC
MLTFSARLPIYRRRKLNPELTQAVEELNHSRREYESHVQQAYFEVKDELIAADTAEQLLKIYREGLIPQAMAAFRAGLAAYETGRENFEALLAGFLDVLNFDEEYWKSLADHETALARIEQLTGVSIH